MTCTAKRVKPRPQTPDDRADKLWAALYLDRAERPAGLP
jgi:hypothetical protein